MSNDPLAEYRGGKALAKPDKAIYQAYDKRDRPVTYTEILCKAQPSQSPQSRFLLGTIFGADYENSITLLYSFMAVEIKGQNLKAVRRAIQNGKCEFIQEYDENEFAAFGKDETVIKSIHFITGEKLDSILTAHKTI